MKKYLFSALALCLTLVGCQKEIVSEVNPDNSVKQQKVSFVAEQSPETKTTMAIDGSTVNYSWSDEDVDFHVFYGETAANTVTPSLAGTKMSLEVSFDENTLPATGTVNFTGYLNGSVKASQTMGADHYYDPSSDVLIAKASVEAADLQSVVPFYFKRMVSVAKFTLNGLPGTPTNVTVSADKSILGSWDKTGSYTPADGSISVAGMSDNVVYLTCAPNENVSFTITAIGTTDGSQWVYIGSTTPKTLTASNVRGMKVTMTSMESFVEEFSSVGVNDVSNSYSCSAQISTSSYVDFTYKWKAWTAATRFEDGVKIGKNGSRGGVVSSDFLSSVPNGTPFTVLIYGAKWANKPTDLTVTHNNSPVTKGIIDSVAEPNDRPYSSHDFVSPIVYSFTKGATDDIDIRSTDERVIIDKVVVFYDNNDVPDGPVSTPYSVTVDSNIAGGSVTASASSAIEGTEITLSATPSTGYSFSSWNVTYAETGASIDVIDNKFIMPAANVNVSATFNEVFSGTITTMSAAEDADIKFVTGSSSSSGAIWAKSAPLSANNITLSGSVTSGTNYSYYDGSVVRFYMNNSIVITPSNGATINKIEIVRQSTTKDNGGTINSSGLTASDKNTATNTNVFTGTAKSAVKFTVTAQARFTEIKVYSSGGGVPPTIYTVTVDDNIANGTVTASPTSAAEGTIVTLTATPNTGYEFDSWNVTNASTSAAIEVTDNKFTMPAANVNVSATFKIPVIPDKTIAEFIANEGGKCYLTGEVSKITGAVYGNYTLTDNSGSIVVYGTLNQEGESRKFGELGVFAGDKIKVLASEYELYNGTTPEAKNVTFVEIVKVGPRYAVNVSSGIANGTVAVSPTQAAEGQIVTITATPNAGYKFKDGSITVTKASGGNVAVTDNKFTMPAESVTVSAEFEKRTGGDPVTVTWVAKDDAANPGNGNDWLEGTIDSNISWSATKGGTNNPKYYDTGSGLRVYTNGTFTVAAANEKKITKIVLTFSGTGYTFSTSNINATQTYNLDSEVSKTWEVSRTCRLQKVEVTYE